MYFFFNSNKIFDEPQFRSVLQTNGFFIECGALDGEYLSNTLYMERVLNWEGILIEADQKAFSQLTVRNRKAYSLPVCLSTKPYPIQVRKFSQFVTYTQRL